MIPEIDMLQAQEIARSSPSVSIVALYAFLAFLIIFPLWLCWENELLRRKRLRDAEAWAAQKQKEEADAEWQQIQLQARHRKEFRRRQSTPELRAPASKERRGEAHLN